MKNEIHIDNYEAFYLDFLEGNLDEETTLTLFAFLAEHPDLQVEDIGPAVLANNLTLDHDFKNILKQNVAQSHINSSNIDYFLTAEKENELSVEKIKELDSFIAAHPAFATERKLYALTQLNADRSLIFKDKKSLKHREPIVLWPLISALVAASAALLIWLWPAPQFSGEINSAAMVPNLKKQGKMSIPSKNSEPLVKNPSSLNSTKNSTLMAKSSTSSQEQSGNKPVLSKLSVRQLNSIQTSRVENIAFQELPEHSAQAIAYQSFENKENNSFALTMNETYKPVTTKLSDVIKTQVDYQTGANVESQRKGFFLKIGTLEIYQNKKAKTVR